MNRMHDGLQLGKYSKPVLTDAQFVWRNPAAHFSVNPV